MWERWKRLRTGEQVLFGVAALLIVVTLLNYAVLESIRMSSGKPMYPIRTHYEFAGEGFRGSELFRKSNCTNCHKAIGNGTNMGLELDGIGSRHDLAYIESFLRDPEHTYSAKTVDHGPAPKEAAYVMQLPPDEQRAIAVFLSQLTSDRGAPTAVAPPSGKSSFIDAMLDMWVPDSWRLVFSDVRGEAARKPGAPAPGPAAAGAPPAGAAPTAPVAPAPETPSQKDESPQGSPNAY